MKLALIGDPVSHSRSPRLHEAFLREAGIEGTYVAIRVPRGNGIDVVRRMRLDGYTGCNVTTPLKEEVIRACDELEEDARMAGAVNTIFFGRTILGANTDGIGARIAVEAILDEAISLQRIGVLGTGATARAILTQLHERDAYTFVWGRDDAKIANLCERFEALPWPDHAPEIVISTLPPDARLPDSLVEALQRCDLVMDTNYGDRSTLERQLHREVIRGDGMLEAQARASFDFWLAHAQESVERFAEYE
ncbi:MAG: shikimate dehydrogenase family protein [Vulcanimicrobiaceae bacterium]